MGTITLGNNIIYHIVSFLLKKKKNERSYNLENIRKLREELIAKDEETWEKEQAFIALVELTSSWVWITGIDGNYIYVSPNVYSIYGFTADQVLGHRPYEFVSDDSREQAKAVSDYLLKEHKPIVNYVSKTQNAAGDVIYVSTSCVPIFDRSGKYKGHVGKEDIITKEQYQKIVVSQ